MLSVSIGIYKLLVQTLDRQPDKNISRFLDDQHIIIELIQKRT
jgi:hypothetical protein